MTAVYTTQQVIKYTQTQGTAGENERESELEEECRKTYGRRVPGRTNHAFVLLEAVCAVSCIVALHSIEDGVVRARLVDDLDDFSNLPGAAFWGW